MIQTKTLTGLPKGDCTVDRYYSVCDYSHNCNCFRCDPERKRAAREKPEESLFKKRIVIDLTAADPSCNDSVSGQIDFIWSLYGDLSNCDPYLRFLYTKLKLTHYLMGCYARQVDTKDAKNESSGESKTVRDDTSTFRSQSTNSNTSFADAVSKSRFDDGSYANSDSGSQRTARMTSYSDTVSKSDDIGYGDGFNDGSSVRTSGSLRVSSNLSDGSGTTDGEGVNSSCNYSYNATKSIGEGINLAVVGADRTASKSGGIKTQYASSSMFQNDKREGTSERHNHGYNNTDGSSTRTSSSYFNAIVDSTSDTNGASDSFDRSNSFRDSRAHADGFGAGQGETRARNNASSQGTTETVRTVESETNSHSTGFTIVDDVKASQRFKHLLSMYEMTERELSDYIAKSASKHGASAKKMGPKQPYCNPGAEALLPTVGCITR